MKGHFWAVSQRQILAVPERIKKLGVSENFIKLKLKLKL